MHALSGPNVTARATARATQPAALSSHQQHVASIRQQSAAPQSQSSAGSLQQPRINQNRVIRGARLISPVGSFLGGLFKQKAAPAVDPRGAEIVEELIELTKKGSKQTAERDEEVQELVG